MSQPKYLNEARVEANRVRAGLKIEYIDYPMGCENTEDFLRLVIYLSTN